MKQISMILLFFLFSGEVCNAQQLNKQNINAISFELGKTGLLYNINFDHKFKNDFGVRFGIGSNLNKYLSVFTTGAGSYYLIGHSKNFLELGVDLFYLSVEENSDDQKGFPLIYPDFPIKTYYASANIDYRRYGAKTLFRIGVSPGFIKDKFLTGGYISYGWRFN